MQSRTFLWLYTPRTKDKYDNQKMKATEMPPQKLKKHKFDVTYSLHPIITK